MNKFFDIAIVIPCYNGWKYMRNCLESLERQTVLPKQVIVVDDCSTDNSYQELINYRGNTNLNLIIKRNSKNCGPGATREKALSYVKTKYVAFCDCDDWYELDFVETIEKELSIAPADIIIFDNNICKEDGSVTKCNSTKALIGLSKNEMIALYHMSLWRMVICADLLKTVVFSHLFHGEDGVVAIQIIANANSIVVKECALYNYLIRTDSISSKPSKKAHLNLIEAYNSIEKVIDSSHKEAVEFVGIKYICYGAVLTAIKSSISSNEIENFINEFDTRHPLWYQNKYIKYLSKGKIIFVWTVKHKLFFVTKMLTKVHSLLTK